MQLDIDLIAKWATAFIAIFSFAKLIVTPFTKVMSGTKATLKSLEDAIKDLKNEIQKSLEDRENIHKLLERHDERIDEVEKNLTEIGTFCKMRNERE